MVLIFVIIQSNVLFFNVGVCLINAESRKNTGAKGGPNSNGSFDYGLFQINSRFWCKIGAVGGACNADCNSM